MSCLCVTGLLLLYAVDGDDTCAESRPIIVNSSSAALHNLDPSRPNTTNADFFESLRTSMERTPKQKLSCTWKQVLWGILTTS